MSRKWKEIFGEARRRDEYWVADFAYKFTEELFMLMERRGINKKQLAELMETSPAYITKIMRGDTNFTIETMVKLARRLDGKLSVHVSPSECNVRWFGVFSTDAQKTSPVRKDSIDQGYSSYEKPEEVDEANEETIAAA